MDKTFNNYELEFAKINQTHEDIKQLEKEMKDLQEIFETINQLVYYQGESINQIEDMIENTTVQVKEGTNELEKANEYVGTSRLFWAGAMLGGIVSGFATYGLSIGIWSVSTIGGSILGGIVGKKL